MGESLKPDTLSREEIVRYGKYSPEQIARIVDASLLQDPENSEAIRTFINKVQLGEQFILLLLKTVNSHGVAFFENIIGICETRIKELQETV